MRLNRKFRATESLEMLLDQPSNFVNFQILWFFAKFYNLKVICSKTNKLEMISTQNSHKYQQNLLKTKQTLEM